MDLNTKDTSVTLGDPCVAHTATPSLPEDAHRGVGRHLHVGLIHKDRLEAGVRVAAGQDLLVELKDLVQEGHGVLEQGQQLGQTEVGHLRRGRW